MSAFLFLLSVIVFLGGIVWLQIFLSKSRKKWPGLVLPCLVFLFSFVPTLTMIGYSTDETTISYIDDEGNEISETTISDPIYDDNTDEEFLFSAATILFIGNLPTAVLLTIHFSVRSKETESNHLDRTRIQDL